MNTGEFEKSLFDRIDNLLQRLDDCSETLSFYHLNKLEHCTSSIFKYHKAHMNSFNYLNKFIKSDKDEFISKLCSEDL
jgi:hypothetical protein